MGNLKGFEKLGAKSKVESSKVISDSTSGNLGIGHFGGNQVKQNVPFGSPLAKGVNPTTDSDDGAGSSLKDGYGLSNPGGASGDGPTPGYNGAGFGNASLDGAQGNTSKRNPNY